MKATSFQAYFPIVAGFVIPAIVWNGIAFLYPIERMIITIMAAVIGAGIMKALQATKFIMLKTAR